MVVLGVYTDMVQFSYWNSYEKYLKMKGSKWTPLVQKGVKSSLGTYVLILKF